MKSSFINRRLPTAVLLSIALATLIYMFSFAGFIKSHGLSGLLFETGSVLMLTQGIMVLLAIWGGLRSLVTAGLTKEA